MPRTFGTQVELSFARGFESVLLTLRWGDGFWSVVRGSHICLDVATLSPPTPEAKKECALSVSSHSLEVLWSLKAKLRFPWPSSSDDKVAG